MQSLILMGLDIFDKLLVVWVCGLVGGEEGIVRMVTG